MIDNLINEINKQKDESVKGVLTVSYILILLKNLLDNKEEIIMLLDSIKDEIE